MTYRERYVFGAPPKDEPPTVGAILNRIADRAIERERQQHQGHDTTEPLLHVR